MRIIINGCNGAMGRALTEAVEIAAYTEIVAGVDIVAVDGGAYKVYTQLSETVESADVVVDFSLPAALPALLEGAKEKKIPLVIATTGHSDDDRRIIEEHALKLPTFVTANMSIGVNLMSDLLHKAAAILGDAFDIEIIEKHHNRKKDAPSGTALALADSLNRAFSPPKKYVYGRQPQSEKRSKEEIGIHSVRAGNLVGEHQVIFAGEDEILQISHTANSRRIFATGALAAARFMMDRPPGLYSMKDVIDAHA